MAVNGKLTGAKRPVERMVCMALLVLLPFGCVPQPTVVVVQPDSPVLIADVRGGHVHLFAHSKQDNEMIEVGWVSLAEYEGWTLLKFDWEAKIARESEGADAGTNRSPDP